MPSPISSSSVTTCPSGTSSQHHHLHGVQRPCRVVQRRQPCQPNFRYWQPSHLHRQTHVVDRSRQFIPGRQRNVDPDRASSPIPRQPPARVLYRRPALFWYRLLLELTNENYSLTSDIGCPLGQNPTKRPIWSRVGSGLGTFATAVVVIVATLAVIISVASHLSPRGQYTVFGHPVLSVLSGSMSPVIKTGDLIYDGPITLAQAEHLHVGQIITFHATADKTFTHRIHALRTVNGLVAYQTKGDANNAPDQALVMPSQIVGLYEGKVPFGGYALNALHKPLSLFLLFLAPTLWLLSTWVFGLAKEADTKRPAAAEREEAALM